ncbi:hypothetical protein ACFFQF_00955 [Haladaptatus pallidirubidus]|uniref:hypothetical protein n=1 Tax=Haladaptatus pallidirubidus TaxID=1008152 RepID=UPI0035E893D7
MAVTGASIETELSRTDTVSGGDLRVGFSHTGTDTVITGQQGADSTDWESLPNPGASLRAYFVLSRAGDDPGRNDFPTRGFATQELHSWELRADLENLPLVVNQSYNDELKSILSEMANQGNFLWAVSYEEGEGLRLDWTKPGQRIAETSFSSERYSIEKDTSRRVQAASVYGSSRDYEDFFYADHGTAIELDQARIQPQTETVTDVNNDTEYARGFDYKIDNRDGTITTLADGRMTDGDRYVATYRYDTYGEYVLPGVDPDEADWLPPKDVSGLINNQSCQQMARVIVEELQEPRFLAEVTIPNEDANWGLVESVRFDDPIADGRALAPKSVTRNLGQTQATFGNGSTFEDMLSQMSAQLSAVTRQSRRQLAIHKH